MRFLLAWAGAWWLVVEAVPTKLPHYVLPAYPALAILAALWLLAPRENRNRLAALAALVAALQFLIGLVVMTAAPMLLPRHFGGQLCRLAGAGRAKAWRLCAGLTALGLFAFRQAPAGADAGAAGRPDHYSRADRGHRARADPAMGQPASGRAGRKRSPAFRSAAHAGGL